MRRRRYSLILAGVGVLALLAIGYLTLLSGGEPKGTEWSFGQSLVMRVTDLQRTEAIRFSERGGHYVVEPTQQGSELVAIQMELQNNESSVVFLSIDDDALKLRAKDRAEYFPVNFRQQAVEVSDALSSEDKFTPFLWGEVELPNKCGQPLQNCQLTGWVIFEIPKDIDLDLVLWEAADTIFLRF